MNPRTHYAYGTGPTLFQDPRETFEKMTTVEIAAQALTEVGTYHMRAGSFAGPLVYKMACDGKTTPGTHFIDPDKCLYKHSCIILNAGFSYKLAVEW